MAILPRFAAMVSSTTIFSTRSSLCTMRNTRRVKGTKVISVTSFVMIMLQKKQSSTRRMEIPLLLPAFRRSSFPRSVNIPSD